MEIGDPPRTFNTTYLGDGLTSMYDLPKQNIDVDTFQVQVENGATLTTLTLGPDYQIDVEQGFLQLTNPVPFGATIITEGTAWGLFTDTDLKKFIEDSINEHGFGRTIKERIRTVQGFISYREEPINLWNLPAIEEPLVIMLATINVFWTLANDAATDTDIQTAEGTNINRLGRYRQLMSHIDDLTMRYQDYCGQLNVGLYMNKTVKLRRKSYTTGRLVPVFEDREYDDHRWPVRNLPPIDHDYDDDSGIPSPLWNSQGY